MLKRLSVTVWFIAICAVAMAQTKNYKMALVGFYNLENLFDTIDGPNDDTEFLPTGGNRYTGKVYRDKLGKLEEVLSQIGTDMSPDGLAMFGCAEIENITVLQDLVAQPKLAKRNYKIVHYDSPDLRGIDVGFIYNPKYFKVLGSDHLFVPLRDDDGSIRYTRDVLWVSGIMDGDTVHVFVNHWPSRRGGEEASAPGRALAASTGKKVIDSLMAINPNTKVLLMGDLNDDPLSPSVAQVLGAKGDQNKVQPGGLFNPWAKYFKEGIGTLAYNDSWNLFDQIIISAGFLPKEQQGYFYHQAHIFSKQFMMQKSGRFKGYPLRTYDGSVYNGGYSDHFPVFIDFLKVVN
jgi:hypothetical protein